MAISPNAYQNGRRTPNETESPLDRDATDGVTTAAPPESIDLDHHDTSYSGSPQPGRREDEASSPTSPLAGSSFGLGRRADGANSATLPLASTTPLVNGVHAVDHTSDDGRIWDGISGYISEYFFSLEDWIDIRMFNSERALPC